MTYWLIYLSLLVICLFNLNIFNFFPLNFYCSRYLHLFVHFLWFRSHFNICKSRFKVSNFFLGLPVSKSSDLRNIVSFFLCYIFSDNSLIRSVFNSASSLNSFTSYNFSNYWISEWWCEFSFSLYCITTLNTTLINNLLLRSLLSVLNLLGIAKLTRISSMGILNWCIGILKWCIGILNWCIGILNWHILRGILGCTLNQLLYHFAWTMLTHLFLRWWKLFCDFLLLLSL